MAVKDWSTTAGSNTAVGSISVAENVMTPGDVNDAIREMMAQIASVIGPNGIGYIVGQGGTVTQATSKSTAVTLNKPTGQITTSNSALAAGATTAFSLSNSFVNANDLVMVNLVSAGGGAHGILDYTVKAGQVANGVVGIAITNETAGTLSEALVISYAVFRGQVA